MQTKTLAQIVLQQKLFDRGAKLVLACSGGADSMALVSVFAALAPRMDWQLFVVHVQHHLRGTEAVRDAEFVRDYCRLHSLLFQQLDVDVLALVEERKYSVEEAARVLRYEALENYLKKIQGQAIVTAHHQDDQAETVLLNLLRGAGTRGLRGMQVRRGNIVRPFLDVARADIEAYCRQQSLAYCQDSTNTDLTMKRNRVRHELLPLLEEFNPQIKKALAATAQLLNEDERHLQSIAQNFLTQYLVVTPEGSFILEVKPCQKLDYAVASRVLRLMLAQAGAAKQQINKEHIDKVLLLMSKGISGKRLALPGLSVLYSRGKLTVQVGVRDNSKLQMLLKR